MHPLWQLKQINTIDGLHYVDRNNAFGNSASGSLLIAFNGLVSWIARNKLHFDYLVSYVYDSFGVDFDGNTLLYQPYNKLMPRLQVLLGLL